MIYFIRNGKLIKVGYTANVDRRMRSFRTTLPEIELLGTMPGERGHERTIHDMLAAFSVGGEWFKDCRTVHDILKCAMRDGIPEWKAARTSARDANEWTARTDALTELICEGVAGHDLPEVNLALGLPSGLLWQMKYRPREVTVGEYYALMGAASRVIEIRRKALERQAEFVRSLEIGDAESDNALFDAERGYRAAKALVGEAGD
jgi:hypothetical protein